MDVMDGAVFGQGAAFTEGLVQLLIGAQLLSLLFVVALLCAAHHPYLFGTVRRSRAFRCPLARREVEVEFLERFLLGVRRSATPSRCSAFEVPTAIECRRHCGERRFRTQWEFALPLARPDDLRRLRETADADTTVILGQGAPRRGRDAPLTASDPVPHSRTSRKSAFSLARSLAVPLHSSAPTSIVGRQRPCE